VLINRSSCPRLAGTLHLSSFPGPGKTSNVQAAALLRCTGATALRYYGETTITDLS
jgi:hypothetical protein